MMEEELIAVVCIDFSDYAKRAFNEALKLWHGPMVLLHVVVEEEHSLKNYVLAGGDTQIVDMVNEESEDDSRRLMKEYVDLAEKRGRHVLTRKIKSTVPGPAIVEELARIKPHIVFMGSRGLSGLKKLFVGSVSQHVVENSACTVVIVK